MAVSLKPGASSCGKEGVSTMHMLAQAQIEDLGLSNNLTELCGSILKPLRDPEAGAWVNTHTCKAWWVGVQDGPLGPCARWGHVKSLWGLCPKRGSSSFPLVLTLKSSSVTPSAEHGAMESRARHLHAGPVFSRSAKTSWPCWLAGLVEEVPSVCGFVHGRLLTLSSPTSSPAQITSDRKPGSSQRPSLPAGGQGS